MPVYLFIEIQNRSSSNLDLKYAFIKKYILSPAFDKIAFTQTDTLHKLQKT